MMEKAVEAQEAQKAAQAGAGAQTGIAATAASAEPRVKKKGSEPQAPRVVPTTTMKYASDVKHRADVEVVGTSVDGNSNGSASNGTGGAAAQLPRKKKSKK